MSPRPSSCDGFTGLLPSFADRELGVAESTALERHLDACSGCQGRLKEIESVGAVLKGWDAQSPAGGPVATRLQHSVLARIAEDGQRRRSELRGLRIRRLALAASVLVAVGLPLSLARETPPAVPAAATSGAEAASPLAAPVRPFEVTGLPEAQRVFHPWDGSPVAVDAPSLEPADREALLVAGLQPQKDLLLEEQFRRATGVAGVWVLDAVNGTRLLLTPEAARFFEKGERLALIRAVNAESFTGEAHPEPRRLGATAGQLLDGVLSGDEGTSAWNESRKAVFGYGRVASNRRPAISAWPLARRETEGAPVEGPEALDPLAAEARHLLSFEASGRDGATVLAIVEGSALPILLPAGQILAGGETDRVVAAATWLPASPRRTVVEVPCLSVRVGTRRPEDGIHLTPYLAGPSLRALLAEGASPQAVLEHVRRLVAAPFGGRAGLEWSLLGLYPGDREDAALASAEVVGFSEQARQGFLVTDGAGRFLGLEHVALRGEAGQLLVRRLLRGYAKEAEWRRTGAEAALPTPTEAAPAALRHLKTSDLRLEVPPVPPGQEVPGAERAVLPEGEAPFAVEALRVDRAPVWVSLLPASAR